MIQTQNLTLTYPSGKGIKDITFRIKEGEVVGYLGPNGAGKTTTIRALMGFMKPKEGLASINGLDCFKDAKEIKHQLGYIPGEITFPDNIDGRGYLAYIAKMRGLEDTNKMEELIRRFELDLHGKVKKYSKGMKQKLGIIIAFMHDPKVLILDEPTSGLDPLMQNNFIELVKEEKAKGKTILMSSHLFEEVERTCDRVFIIKEGRIIQESNVAKLKSSQRKAFVIKTPDKEKLQQFGYHMEETPEGGILYIKGEDLNPFLQKLSTIHVTSLDIKTQGLEEIFMSYYGEGQ